MLDQSERREEEEERHKKKITGYCAQEGKEKKMIIKKFVSAQLYFIYF